jgi:hypothetical protein
VKPLVVRPPPLIAAPPLISVPSEGLQLVVTFWLVVEVVGPLTSREWTVTVTPLVFTPGWLQIA